MIYLFIFNLFKMPSLSIISVVFIGFVTITSLTISVYTLVDYVSYDKPVSAIGPVGPRGEKGDNGTCDNTTLIDLYELYLDLNTSASSLEFCEIETCNVLDFVVNDINNIIDTSGIRGITLNPLSEAINNAFNITTNGTFCSLSLCEYNELILSILLDTFGSTNATGLIDQVAQQLGELTILTSNNTFAKFPITDESIVNNSISLYKINGINPNSVVVTNNASILTTTPFLSTEYGGTGTDTTLWNGFVYIDDGSWSFLERIPYENITLDGDITDADISVTARISINKINPFTSDPNEVVITSPSGTLTTERYVSTSRGCFGMDMSNATGYTFWDFGVPTMVTSIPRLFIASTVPNAVVVNNPSGLLSTQTTLSTSNGGIGKDASTFNGFLFASNGNITSLSIPISSNYVNMTSKIRDSDILLNASIARNKIAQGSSNHVLINDASGLMSSEPQLSTTRGGTGIDSSALTGFLRIVSGVWSALAQIPYSSLLLTNTIVNTDIAANASIERSKLAIGTANHVVINSAGGVLTSEARLAVSRGGTGQDFSAVVSSILLVTSGVFSSVQYAYTTYTPQLSFGSATTGIVQSSTLGRYQIIDKTVTTLVYIALSSKGTATGSARISLPVAAVSPSSGAAALIYPEFIDIPTNYNNLFIAIESGVASGLLVFTGDNVPTAVASDTSFLSNSTMRFTFVYIAA